MENIRAMIKMISGLEPSCEESGLNAGWAWVGEATDSDEEGRSEVGKLLSSASAIRIAGEQVGRCTPDKPT
jgi:hypothetical protein